MKILRQLILGTASSTPRKKATESRPTRTLLIKRTNHRGPYRSDWLGFNQEDEVAILVVTALLR